MLSDAYLVFKASHEATVLHTKFVTEIPDVTNNLSQV